MEPRPRRSYRSGSTPACMPRRNRTRSHPRNGKPGCRTCTPGSFAHTSHSAATAGRAEYPSCRNPDLFVSLPAIFRRRIRRWCHTQALRIRTEGRPSRTARRGSPAKGNRSQLRHPPRHRRLPRRRFPPRHHNRTLRSLTHPPRKPGILQHRIRRRIRPGSLERMLDPRPRYRNQAPARVRSTTPMDEHRTSFPPREIKPTCHRCVNRHSDSPRSSLSAAHSGCSRITCRSTRRTLSWRVPPSVARRGRSHCLRHCARSAAPRALLR